MQAESKYSGWTLILLVAVIILSAALGIIIREVRNRNLECPYHSRDFSLEAMEGLDLWIKKQEATIKLAKGLQYAWRIRAQEALNGPAVPDGQ